MISQNELKEILDYNPNTGVFRWKKITSNRVKIGSVAGTFNKERGYIELYIYNISYKAHRLAWFYMTGNWPKEQIDHINGIRDDNRWINLRECTNAENSQNKVLTINKLSGYPCVTWAKHAKKWHTKIQINRKQIHLGYFDDPAIAYQAYLDAKQKYHKFNPIPR